MTVQKDSVQEAGERVHMTADEWRAKGRELFGNDIADWRFKCPNCGNVAEGREFKDIKASPHAIYQECIGRWIKGKGCDWAAYGLFDITKVHVDGAKVFEFAPVQKDQEGSS